ncbi:MAG: hypothetical protein Q7R33_05170 [Nitrosarchaeum sp.]|nr:hypothetical protein [Nitrosarchaeum sp.]
MDKIWSARVHQSGDRIQLLKNGSVTKIIRTGSDTFKPIEAKAFAENLISTLNAKYAKQMKNPDDQPSVASKGEQHQKSLDVAEKDAKGIAVKDAEVRLLKKKIATMEKEAAVERKARRGLAIVKQLVTQNKVANDESVIKGEVMKIVAMSNDEINMLEKKVAGTALYDTTVDAEKAARRYARLSRLHRQAAEDAQLAGDEELADDEDTKAERYASIAKDASNEAAKLYSQFNNKVDSITSDDAVNQADKDAKGVDVNGKKTAAADEVSDEMIDSTDENELIDDVDDDDMNKDAAAAIYHKIAADHRKKAEELKVSGDEEQCKVEEEIAKEADELADSIEDDIDDAEETDEDFSKEAATIYRKIAADHRKKADDYEAEGKSDQADKEDEVADEAEKMAESIEASAKVAETTEGEKVATVDEKVAVVEGEKAVVAATTEGEKVATVEGEKAVEGEKVAVATEGEKAAAKTDENMDIMMMAGTDADDKGAKQATDDQDADDEKDPLADLLTEEEVKEATAEVEEPITDSDDSMPTDEEVDAAFAPENVNEDETADEIGTDETTKEAAGKGTKKIANQGYSQTQNVEKLEQNPMANDSQVAQLEDFWRETRGY